MHPESTSRAVSALAGSARLRSFIIILSSSVGGVVPRAPTGAGAADWASQSGRNQVLLMHRVRREGGAGTDSDARRSERDVAQSLNRCWAPIERGEATRSADTSKARMHTIAAMEWTGAQAPPQSPRTIDPCALWVGARLWCAVGLAETTTPAPVLWDT